MSGQNIKILKLVIIIGAVVIAALSAILLLPQRGSAPEAAPLVSKTSPHTAMRISSPSLAHNQPIPKNYTCDGRNDRPELIINDVPPTARSLAIIVDDPDAPGGTFTHWTAWNINPKLSSIPDGAVPAGIVEGTNSDGKTGYVGPCPPPGKVHHYHFKVYALDAKLDLPAGAAVRDLETAINAHFLASTELIGLYGR